MKKIGENERGIFLPALKAQIVWIVSGTALLLIFCMIAYSSKDPGSLIMPLSTCALYLSAMICGIAAVRISGDGIASGILAGLITALLVFVLSLIPMGGDARDFITTLLFDMLIIPATVLGAIIGRPRKSGVKKHRAKMKKMRR